MTRQTIAGASEYWERYYGSEFIFGLGTEQILAALRQVPPAETWIDTGAGSESLLWSIALRARRLIAVDRDGHRLRDTPRLRRRPPPPGRLPDRLALCDRTQGDFTARCAEAVRHTDRRLPQRAAPAACAPAPRTGDPVRAPRPDQRPRATSPGHGPPATNRSPPEAGPPGPTGPPPASRAASASPASSTRPPSPRPA